MATPGPCVVVPGDPITGYVLTAGLSRGVTNFGSVGLTIQTNGADSGVINSGSVGEDIITLGANSGVTNSGSVGRHIFTSGDNSSVTNSGSVGGFIYAEEMNSDVMNSGSVGAFIQTSKANSSVTNSGSVGSYVYTEGNNSGVTNSGSVGEYIFTGLRNSSVSNSGSVGTYIRTLRNNSSVTNSGSVGTYIQTFGNNSSVSNSGSVGSYIYTEGQNSGVTNSGSVGSFIFTVLENGSVTNSGSVGRYILTQGDDSSVTNSGSVGSGAAGHGIFLRGANPTLTLLPGSVVQGALQMSTNGTRTLNVGPGLSIASEFSVGGGFGVPTTINTFGAPFVVSGNQVVVVDPTSLALQDEVVADLTNGISNAVFQAIGSARTGAGAGPAGSQPLFLSSRDGVSASAETALRYWGKTFGSRREQDGDGPSADAQHWIIGTVSGVDAPISANMRAGGFLGGSKGQVEAAFDSQETDIDSFFGGVYVGSQMGAVSFDFAVMGGWTGNELERRVANNAVAGGIQTAEADYDGYFIAPEIAISATTGFGLVPSAKLRYVNYQLDGYQESGALGNFAVDDRDMEILQGRFQIAAPFITSGEDSAYTRIEPYAGVEFRSLLSGDKIDAVLLGQTLSFGPGGDDDITAFYAGISASARIASNVELFANAEANFEDEDTYRYGGNVGAKVTF